MMAARLMFKMPIFRCSWILKEKYLLLVPIGKTPNIKPILMMVMIKGIILKLRKSSSLLVLKGKVVLINRICKGQTLRKTF
jgi:hypothetical protein